MRIGDEILPLAITSISSCTQDQAPRVQLACFPHVGHSDYSHPSINRGRHLPFSSWLLINSTDPANQLAWLVKQLMAAEMNGEKVSSTAQTIFQDCVIIDALRLFLAGTHYWSHSNWYQYVSQGLELELPSYYQQVSEGGREGKRGKGREGGREGKREREGGREGVYSANQAACNLVVRASFILLNLSK